MKPASTPPRRWWPLLAAACALPGLLAWLGPGHYVGNGTDLYSYQIPLREGVAALWRSGQAPWWNPYVLGGVPALAGWQLGLLYPPHLLHLLAPIAATEAMIWLHVALFGTGTAVLLRAWRPELPAWAPPLLALVTGLSGPVWGHLWAGHVSYVEALAWLPWLWWAAVRLVDARLPRYAVAGAAFLALQLLVGHPQVVYLTVVGLVAVLAARALAEPQQAATGAPAWLAKPLHSVVALGGLLAIGAGAALLALPQLTATVDVLPDLNRSLSTPLEIATSYSAPASSLWTALAPELFGGAQGKWASFSYHETVGFVGLGLLALAVAGAARGPSSWLLSGAVGLALLLAPGEHGPLLPRLVGVVPGLGSFRVPGRWVTLLPLLVALLAADGLAGLLRPAVAKATPSKATWIALALALLGLLWAATDLLGGQGGLVLALAKAPADVQAAAATGAQTAVFMACCALVAVAVAVLRPAWAQALVLVLLVGSALQGFSFAQSHLGAASRRPSAAVAWGEPDRALLRQVVPANQRLLTAAGLRMANWGTTAGVAVAGGYEPAITANANRYGNGFAGRQLDGYAVNFQARSPNAFVARMAVSHLVVGPDDRATAQAFAAWPVVLTLASDLQVRENPKPWPRMAVADRFEAAATPQAALQRIQADPEAPVQLSGATSALPSPTAGTLVLEVDRPGHVEAASHCATPCVAVLRDSADRGWQAQVDGTPVPSLIADGAFRAVVVSAGDHRVTWHYQPAGWPWSPALALVGWLAAAAWLWRSREQGKQPGDTSK